MVLDDAQPDTHRQRWLAVLARLDPQDLEAAMARLPARPEYRCLKPAETGLVMVRGRAGGTGQPFNLGEMSVTRCVVALAGGQTGVGYVAGRDSRRAELVALFDALLQDPAHAERIQHDLVEPGDAQLRARRATQRAKAGATRVDFFTMVRGE
jgi:alpha-D-ribose 1-methylphosphonate 5-triphosphate synthase subunit PhnG